MEQQSPAFFRHGPSPAVRLTFFILLSLMFLVSDAHYNYLETLRKALGTLTYPLQRLANAPAAFFDYAGNLLSMQSRLLGENQQLQKRFLLDQSLLLRLKAQEQENIRLRLLLDAKSRQDKPAVMAEIMYTARDPFSRKIIIDKGSQQNIETGSAVIDGIGLIGQVRRTYAYASEISLITDKDQPTPIQVERNGLRAILFGFGSESLLDLRYMSPNADIKVGDVLLTSGIDGTYAAGLPVAVVAKVDRNPAYAFAKIVCTPSAGVDRHKEVLVLAPARTLPAENDLDKKEK